MKIEAVTVCVNYGDILEETVKYNIGHLDRWTIATSPDDTKTKEVCKIYDLECIISEDWKENGHFNKGKMIDRGLQHCSNNAWRLHIDADIVLPVQFKRMLEAAQLDKSKLYGCDRIKIHSWEEWQSIKHLVCFQHSHCAVNFISGTFVGTRYVLSNMGYVPIGFFQLWHSKADELDGWRFRKYPTLHGDAHRTDVQFALQWDRKDRELLPEIIVYHLESEKGGLGVNWEGRKSRPFGPNNNVKSMKGPS